MACAPEIDEGEITMSVTDDFALPGEEQTPPAGTATQQPQSGSGLRQQLEQSLAEKTAATARVKELEATLRKRDLTDLVKGAGLPESAAARYPADAEVTPEKVTAWADAEKAYAQSLTGQPAPPQAGEPPAATQPAPPAVPPEVQRAMGQVDQAQAGAQPPVQGLEGMHQRLQDRSVPWPQLQEELKAMGFRDQ